MKFYHLFLHLIRVIQLYIIQLRISLRKRNNVLGFENIKIINTQQLLTNLQKSLTKAKFTNEKVGIISFLLFKQCTFKNVDTIFTLKTPICNNSFYVIYVFIGSGYLKNHIRETVAGETRFRDRVRVCRHHIK